MWNQAVEWYTGCAEVHCELYFPHTRETCNISSDRPVELVGGRKYDSRDWSAYDVHVSPAQREAAYAFCASQVGKPFDRRGRNLFCISELFCCGNVWLCSEDAANDVTPSSLAIHPADDTPSAWVCSRLTCVALKKAGVFGQLDEWRCTPGQLRVHLQFQAEQSKQQGLRLTGLQRALGQPHVTPVRLPKPPPIDASRFLGSS